MTTNINPYQQPMAQPYMMNPMMVNPRMPQQKAATEVNAVKIELIEPKAYNGAPETCSAPYYNYPQASMYDPNSMVAYPYAPQLPQYQSQPMPMMYPQPSQYQPQPMPMTYPQPPVQQMPVEQAPMQQPAMPAVPPPVVETQPQQPAAQPTAPQQPDVQQPAAQQPNAQPAVDVNKMVQDLNSNDLELQFNTINKIAELAQSQSPDAMNLLAVDTFKGLASVINKDTATLEAPTQEQTALREKALNGQQLSPEEQAKAEQLAPQEVAEMNKQYALYTLAILQNSYRDAVNQELQAQNMQPAKINELPEINLIIDTIKSNPNALIREAGISALSYVVKPEDKDVAKTVFSLATQDSDPNVKNAAAEALGKIGEPVPAAAPVGNEEVKESKKDKKAKKAEKANEQQQANVKQEAPKAEESKAA